MTQETEHPWRDAERLERMYWDERMTQGEIAEELGCTRRTIAEWMKRLDVETRPGKTTKTLEQRFWEKVDKGDPDECWEWQAKRTWFGYGQIKVDGMMQNAHRIALELEQGDLGDLFACHTCDNPPCVNPNHLYAGTPSDNMQDAWERGDHDFSGENNPNAKLTWDDVRRIRDLRGLVDAKELAEEFGVKEGQIHTVWRFEAWDPSKRGEADG